MKYGRRAHAAAALAVAAAVAVAVAGCTAGPASTAASGGGAAPTLTTAEASQAFSSYVRTTSSAFADGDQAAALSVAEDVQWSQVKADFLTASYFHLPLPRYSFGSPSFYLPEPGGYPQWFVASVRRTVSMPAAQPLAGVPLTASGQVLMLFTKRDAAGPWLLASTSQLPQGMAMPKLATSGGHVEQVAASATKLLAGPDITGPLQAAVVDDGPSSAAARAVASGPLTTGMYAVQAAGARSQTPRGDVTQWELEGAGYGQFALRTASGGALVFYDMYLDTTTEVPAELAESSPVPAGPPIAVPREFEPFLQPGKQAPRKRLITQLLLAFAAVDPASAAGSPKIQVIGIGGGPKYASAS